MAYGELCGTLCCGLSTADCAGLTACCMQAEEGSRNEHCRRDTPKPDQFQSILPSARAVFFAVRRVSASTRHAEGTLQFQRFPARARLVICVWCQSELDLLLAAQHGGHLLQGVGNLLVWWWFENSKAYLYYFFIVKKLPVRHSLRLAVVFEGTQRMPRLCGSSTRIVRTAMEDDSVKK